VFSFSKKNKQFRPCLLQYSPAKGDAFPASRTAQRLLRTRNASPFLSLQNKPATALLRMCNASPFRSIIHYDFLNVSRYREINPQDFTNFFPRSLSRTASQAMATDALIHSRHAWSLMNEKDLAHKLHKLGLILNRPEPALICRQCKYALQPSGIRVSKHLAEKHTVPASYRKELVSYVDSLDLPNPNLLGGRRNGSEPHPHLLVSRRAACKFCTFHSKSSRLVQQHITRNH
jgi:hypothetical protein